MVDPQGCLNRMLNLVSLDQESCYNSSFSRASGDSVLGKSMISMETRPVGIADQGRNLLQCLRAVII